MNKRELHVGIVGMGTIGRAIAQALDKRDMAARSSAAIEDTRLLCPSQAAEQDLHAEGEQCKEEKGLKHFALVLCQVFPCDVWATEKVAPLITTRHPYIGPFGGVGNAL
jgi:homoserine dehydrogenase